MTDYTRFEQQIGYVFKDKSLLITALTHTSYANEHKTKSFERMEFLGDSILGFVVAENLFTTMPDKNEGVLSKTRASIVCEESLSEVARKLDIPNRILLGLGEEKCNGRQKNSIISDVVEAIIAAIYLDGGFIPAKEFINRVIPLESYSKFQNQDYKSALQEKFKRSTVRYKTDELGGSFVARVWINDTLYGEGKGQNKKSAEQMAAQNALNKQR